MLSPLHARCRCSAPSASRAPDQAVRLRKQEIADMDGLAEDAFARIKSALVAAAKLAHPVRGRIGQWGGCGATSSP